MLTYRIEEQTEIIFILPTFTMMSICKYIRIRLFGRCTYEIIPIIIILNSAFRLWIMDATVIVTQIFISLSLFMKHYPNNKISIHDSLMCTHFTYYTLPPLSPQQISNENSPKIIDIPE